MIHLLNIHFFSVFFSFFASRHWNVYYYMQLPFCSMLCSCAIKIINWYENHRLLTPSDYQALFQQFWSVTLLAYRDATLALVYGLEYSSCQSKRWIRLMVAADGAWQLTTISGKYDFQCKCLYTAYENHRLWYIQRPLSFIVAAVKRYAFGISGRYIVAGIWLQV